MASDAAIAQAMYATRTAGYAACASLTLAAYEAVINLDREVTAVWCRKNPAGTKGTYRIPVLMFILRWTPVLQILLQWINNPPSICAFSIAGSQVIYIVMALALAVFGALRVYSMTQRYKRTLAITTGLLMGVPATFNVLSIVRATYSFIGPPFNQCTQVTTIDQRTNTIMSWVALAFATSGSFLALFFTWKTNFRQYHDVQKLGFKTPLSGILMKGGAVYFLLLLALNVTQLVLLSLSATTSEMVVLDAAYVQPFLQVTPAIIVCRFILELREPAQTPHTPELFSAGESIVFEGPSVNNLRGRGELRGRRQPINGSGFGAMDNLSDIMLDDIRIAEVA